MAKVGWHYFAARCKVVSPCRELPYPQVCGCFTGLTGRHPALAIWLVLGQSDAIGNIAVGGPRDWAGLRWRALPSARRELVEGVPRRLSCGGRLSMRVAVFMAKEAAGRAAELAIGAPH